MAALLTNSLTCLTSMNMPRLAQVLGLVCLLTTSLQAANRPVDYNRDIRPILSDRCFYCHGPDEEHRQADLRLDDESSAKAAAIVPKSPETSELVKRILSTEADLQMPPPDSGKKLSGAEIQLLQRWVAEGAPYAPFWAYVPPRKHPVPETEASHWIDDFIQHRLQQEGLASAPAADPVTLIRRLSFDLTGLPPEPELVEKFVSNPSPEAYEQLVDQFLASDRYGERLAAYWLDLVRFADTVGYHGDQDHNISPYRDYVLDAFNENLPFDQFTREQLAGDLLPNATLDQKIATGYNRMLQTSHEGGVQPKEYLSIYSADRVRNLSAVWMGATVGCSQCHNHKFDPYTIKDFYSLAAFFADVDEAQHFKVGSNDLPTRRPPEIRVLSKRERQRLQTLQDQLAELQSRPEKDQSQADIDHLKAQIETLEKSARLTMVTQSIQPREIRLLPRGNWLDDSGPVMTPEIPEFLGTLKPSGSHATRLDLANWLVDPEQGVGGLTARVFVNRLWALFFGSGLAGSLDDFGGQGEPPMHPELLDNLAIEFIDSGWNIKKLIRQMVLTETYRQSSQGTPNSLERDPLNRLYARQSRHRLAAEMIRDNALAISGLLVLDYGGPSVKPYQPAGYYRHLNFPVREYQADTGAPQWRRGVYVHWQRQFLHPMLKAFDAPSREECTAQRPQSNTPLAALVLLNDPSFVEAARAFSARLLTQGESNDSARLNLAFRLAVSRPPDEFEQQHLLSLLKSTREKYQANPGSAEELLKTGLAPIPEEVSAVELASWTMVTRILLNLDETITRR